MLSRFLNYAFGCFYFASKCQSFVFALRKCLPTTRHLEIFAFFSNLKKALQFVPLGADIVIFLDKSTILHMPPRSFYSIFARFPVDWTGVFDVISWILFPSSVLRGLLSSRNFLKILKIQKLYWQQYQDIHKI